MLEISRVTPKNAEFTSCKTLAEIATSCSTMCTTLSIEVSGSQSALRSSAYVRGKDGSSRREPTKLASILLLSTSIKLVGVQLLACNASGSHGLSKN